MPKRKSSDREDIHSLKKRLKSLEEKLKNKTVSRRRIRVIEDLSSSSESSRDPSPSPENLEVGDTLDPVERTITNPTQDDITQILDGCTSSDAKAVPADPAHDTNSASDAALDDIILELLGDDPSTSTEYGKDIHSQLASRFEYFVLNGLTKEVRKELKDKYLVPSNCTLIGAPTLNAEIKAALNENYVKRDKAIEARQKVLAKSISSVALMITDQLKSTNKNQDLLKNLMDTGRMLCDIQHGDSVIRRSFALASVKKDLKEHLLSTKIHKYLFGENLADTLKAAKAVSKSGTDLKVKTNSSFNKPTPAPKNQNTKNLNWKPPAPVRRQQGPQRSREPATRKQPPQSSKRSPRRSGTTRRQ